MPIRSFSARQNPTEDLCSTGALPEIHLIRSFTVYQLDDGWYWSMPGLNRDVGPFPTLEEVCSDLQRMMDGSLK